MTDHTNPTNMSSFFDELVRAKQAMETLPTVQAELDRTKGEHGVIRERFETLATAHTTLQQTLTDTEAKLKDATFRESEVRAKLEILTGLLKDVVGEANLAIEMVEPRPEPLSEPVRQEATHGSAELNADAAKLQSMGQDPGPTLDAVSVSSDPTQGQGNTGQSQESTAGGTPSTADGGQVSSEPTDLPGLFPWERPKIGDAEDLGMVRSYEREATRESSPNPTITKMDAGRDATIKDADSTPNAPTASTSSFGDTKPLPKPYWEKPSNITWLTWRGQGNDIAPWCRQQTDDQLNNIFN